MKGLTVIFRRNNLLIRIILSYALVCLLFIGVFSYAVMNRISSDLTRDTNESNERMTEQMYNTADLLLSSTYNHFAQVFGSNDIVFNAMYADSYSPIETYKINEYLNDLIIANPLVRSVYVYNMKKKIVFSSLSMVSDFNDFFDADMSRMLEKADFSGQGAFIPRQEQFNYLNKKYDNKLITVIYSEYGSNKTMEGAFVLNIDQQVLHKLVTKGTASSTQQSFILNGQGTVISSSDNSSIHQNISHQHMFDEVLQSKENRGRIIQSVLGKPYLISYIKSDRLGWSFVGVAEHGSLLQKVNATKQFVAWVSLFFVLAAAVTAFFSTRMIYIPLRRLVKRIQTSDVVQEEGAALGEYDLLARSFSSYEDMIRHLKNKVSGFIPGKKNELLRSVICDGILPSHTDMQEFGIHLNGGYYRICLLRIDAYQEQMKRYDTSDISLLKYAIGNIAQELVSPYYVTEVWSDNGDSVALIFNIEHDNSSKADIESLLHEIQTNIADYLRLSVTVAIGPVVQEMDRIRHSWKHAYRLSQYRLVSGTGSIITHDFESIRDSSGAEGVLSLEKTIMDSLKVGDTGKLRDSVADFMHRVSCFHYDDLIEHLSQLMLVTVRVSKGILEEEELLQTGVYSLPQALYQRETLDEIHTSYLEVLGSVLALREKRLSVKKSKVVENMEEIIHKQYGNPDFSVDQLAEMVELSTNYARKIFKEQMGNSISQYITEYRFAKAQDLLVQTDIPASRIGEMVGIANTNYFYSSFKKYCGNTPDQYRRSLKPKTNMT